MYIHSERPNINDAVNSLYKTKLDNGLALNFFFLKTFGILYE